MSSFIALLCEFFTRICNGFRVLILRIGGKLATAMGSPIPGGFFDGYPKFYDTSVTTAFANRLNQRHRACIESNEMVIRGKRILDIASHDGRWSFAALKAGASHVTGIEARDYLVQAASTNLRKYGLPENSFRFVVGDVFGAIDQMEPESVDTVFCFGFFYHIVNHMLLLSKIARLKPKHILLDTVVLNEPRRIIALQSEDPESEGDAARTGAEAQKIILAGIASRKALEFMLSSFGWSFEYYDWQKAGIRRWDHIEDYHEGARVSMRITCNA